MFDCSRGIIKILYRDPAQDISVRTSTIKDMLIMDKLMKENTHAVGFIPKTYFEKYGVWDKGKYKPTSRLRASDDINLWKINMNSKMLTLFD